MADARLERLTWRDGRTNVDALTIACIEHAEAIVRDLASATAHDFVVTQGSYQDSHGDINSAGTHDLGGVVDLRWCGHSVCVRALRMAGMAAWHRTPEQGPWPDHVHAVALGHPLLAPAAARQVLSYLDGRDGLKDNGPDDGPRLNPIPRPVWPWPQEEDMPLTPADAELVAKAVLDAEIAADGRTVRKALRQASKAAEVADQVADRVAKLLLDEPGDVAATVDAEQIKAAVKQALREGVGD